MSLTSLQTSASVLIGLASASNASVSDIRDVLSDCASSPARDLLDLLDLAPIGPQDVPAVAQAASAYLSAAAHARISSFEDCERDREIGRGCFGSVFLAKDRKTRRDIALKIYRLPFPEARDGDVPLRGLFNELRFQMAADDRAVVRVLRCGLTRGAEPYLALEYMPGGTLADAVQDLARSKDLSADSALVLAKRTLRAAARVHGAGIVHGDMDIRNFLSDGESRLKLADFATARRLNEKPYRFEKMLRKDREPEGIAYDVFQLGKILYRIFTRCPNDISDVSVERAPVPSRKRPDLEIPPWIDELVTTALLPDPAARWPHAMAMRDFLLAKN